MKIIEKISLAELKVMAQKMFGEIVKADVDIAKVIVILDMPMHYDGEQELLEKGSNKIILDAYNANPSSVKVAIENFKVC